MILYRPPKRPGTPDFGQCQANGAVRPATQEGYVTDRSSRAIDQLGSDDLGYHRGTPAPAPAPVVTRNVLVRGPRQFEPRSGMGR
ncbi:hypothetical protein SAMN04487981_113230 [Streptomyces sp. cf386]|nr:hypothetical protein SAMN04487981_113230 [Streptomyces sp. cf386]